MLEYFFSAAALGEAWGWINGHWGLWRSGASGLGVPMGLFLWDFTGLGWAHHGSQCLFGNHAFGNII
jgi:hypothetical protein